MTQVFSKIGLMILGLLMAATGIWGVLALYYAGPPNVTLRYGLAATYSLVALSTLTVLFSRRWRWRAFTVYCAVLAVLLYWYLGITPSNDRDWQPDVAVLSYATFEGNMVTVHNIRNFDYRSEFDYTPAYYDKSFDLRKLEGVDVVSVYWMGPAIAHVFLSFAFKGGDHLAISIETRKEKGEGYSTLRGFFRQYELYYVVGDERDVIRLRTNYRHNPPEDVYIYRAQGSTANGQRLFLEYMKQLNALKTKPEFYNTLTTNCTTNIWLNTRVNRSHPPLSWKILASGYLPQYLYDSGRLITYGLPFSELRRRAHINALAQAADNAEDFSRRIREQ